jgi:branched-chain amino acid transport system ATP-binding protein
MLDVRELVGGYGSFEVLHDVSVCVPAGEIVALLGHNGAGKSTLLKSIYGVIPARGGQVLYDGRLLERRTAGAMAYGGIRYVPQDANVFANLSVHDNLKLGAYVLNPRPPELARRLEEVFTLFPVLRERQSAPARVLSGGQRQMLAISIALMTSPKVLLLDEPSSGLSPVNVQRVFDAIGVMRESLGTSVLLVEQNVNEALRLAGRAYVMQEGRIVFEAPSVERDAIIHHLWGLTAIETVAEEGGV